MGENTFTINVNVQHHHDPALERLNGKLDRILDQLLHIQMQERQEMINLDALKASVEKETTVTQSAITLMQQLSDLIEQNKADPVALQALADQIDAQASALGSAVQANTPAPTTP